VSTYPERSLGEILHLELDEEPIEPERTYLTAGIYSHGRGLFKRPPIEGSETSYSKYTKLHVGQFIYSKLFGWEGATAIVEPEFDGLYVSQEFPTFRINTALASPAYVSFLAQWNGLHFRLKDKGTGVGSRRQRVGVDRLLATPIPLPSLDEQRRIAARLDSAFIKLGAIESAHVRSAALRTALTDRLLSDSGAETSLGEFLVPCDDVIDVTPTETYNTAGILSYGRGLFARPSIQGSETSYKRYNRIRAGQFVYSKLFGWEGALAVVPLEFDGFFMSHEFPSFAVRESHADTSYVGHLASWARLHDRLRDKGTGMGSRRQRISPDRLMSTIIPLPGLPEQRRVASMLDKVTRSTQAAEAQVAGAKHFRSTLLNAAFSGWL
jgi:type I restriction enzyme S subunit